MDKDDCETDKQVELENGLADDELDESVGDWDKIELVELDSLLFRALVVLDCCLGVVFFLILLVVEKFFSCIIFNLRMLWCSIRACVRSDGEHDGSLKKYVRNMLSRPSLVN